MCRVERHENAEVVRVKINGERHYKIKIRSGRSGSLTTRRVKLVVQNLSKMNAEGNKDRLRIEDDTK